MRRRLEEAGVLGETGRLFPDERFPPGLRYEPELVSREEEARLVALLEALPLEEVRLRGQVARRRVAHFGARYAHGSRGVADTEPIPAFLEALRDRAAALVDSPPEAFEEALVTLYPKGAAIGWHRDAPAFGPVVVGVSLGAPCRMRFRQVGESARRAFTTVLEPRSGYVLGGPARSAYEHTIPPLETPRWSVTFRTIAETRRG